MLKSSKLSHKSHKSSKDSAVRKSHLMKKAMRSRSPVRVSGNSRGPPLKHGSPVMKRGHPIPKRKASHSPRLRSIASPPRRSLSHRSKQDSPASIDRAHLKSLKYEKRRQISNSPPRHLGPSTSRRPVLPPEPRPMSPYLDARYQSGSIPRSPQYSPGRKKARREPEYVRAASISPPRRLPPLHSDGHISRRDASPVLHPKHHRGIPVEKHSYPPRSKPDSSPPPMMSSSRSKDPSLKVPYASERSRYRSASPNDRYPPPGASKPYAPTLHERFSTVVESTRTEPRIRYSREDLEKITIDIRHNLREPSPPPRHLVDRSEVKLLRRENEGRRPIFDREELKQAPRDLREDPYYERKSSSYGASHVDLREVENYQIIRHKYDSRHEVVTASGRPVSDRWPNHDGRKDAVALDRDEREREYARIPARSRPEIRSRSRSGDRDFRSERYLEPKPSSSRGDYPGRPPVPIPEPRDPVPYPNRRGPVPVEPRHKLKNHSPALRPEPKSHHLPPDHYVDPYPPPRMERRDHSPIPEPRKWDYKSRSPSRENLPEYSRRPEKFYKPDIPPRSPNFFEYESREGPPSSFRGGSRPFRSSRGFRARGFRGSPRGGSYRGSFRGGYRTPNSPRGRGIPRR